MLLKALWMLMCPMLQLEVLPLVLAAVNAAVDGGALSAAAGIPSTMSLLLLPLILFLALLMPLVLLPTCGL